MFMQFAKRIFLFITLNIIVITTISIILSVLHVQPYLSQYGLDIPSLAIFCLVWGFGGAFISLAMSRAIAKWSYGVQLIDPDNCSQRERWLVDMVQRLCSKAGINTLPEIGIYQSQEANAFATGPTKSRALVAVSSGILDLMNADELEGVLGHEISHVANGDMVTMTLLQGVVNAFVMFASRVIAYAITRGDSKSDRSGWAFYLVSMVLQTIFLLFGSLLIALYNRKRECKADDGGAQLAGRNKMIGALEALKRTSDLVDPRAQPAVQAMKISGHGGGIWKFFNLSTHPPLEERIARLRNQLG
jgi:heat shock protein HtpX